MALKKSKNYCFGCGPDNPHGMRLKFVIDTKHSVATCSVRLEPRFAGPPGYCHGGIIATILDEAMAKLNLLGGVTAVTGQLRVDYLRPVPLEKKLLLNARETRVTGRRRFRTAEILNQQGKLLARATGVFITIDPARMFNKSA